METSQTRVFPGRFDVLVAVSEFIARAAEAADLDDCATYQVQLAVDEAFTNIVRHAYGGEGQGEVVCIWRVDDQELTVILQDTGRPFQPESIPEPDIHASLEERKVGGLGLYFIRNLMDEVHFEFTKEGNTLTMVKRREEAS